MLSRVFANDYNNINHLYMKNLLDNYEAFVFDFDLTLADGSEWIVECFQTVLRRHGYTQVADAACKATIGMTIEDAFAQLTGVNDWDRNHALRDEYAAVCRPKMAEKTHFYPEALRFLHDLKKHGKRTGILSTKMSRVILQSVEACQLTDCFQCILGITDVQTPKPDPSGLQLAMRRLQVNPSDCLYIGDSLIDAETAQRAGVDFIGTLTGVTTREMFAAFPHKALVRDLGELI